MKRILVTGSAGFIGFHTVIKLLEEGYSLVCIDNLNNYYDPRLKKIRVKEIEKLVSKESLTDNYEFLKLDIRDKHSIDKLFANYSFDAVIHLAAQAGVRFSIKNPMSYIENNLVGFANILEGCRAHKIKHFLFASSSSVYGLNQKTPFSTEHLSDFPISLYAATKKSNELMAFSYSHLYSIPTTGLRFFTVYGPYGRPDMAYFKFTEAILNGAPIDIFNHGKQKRDFTYIDDIVEGVIKLIKNIPELRQHNMTNALAPFTLYNIGNNKPISLDYFIELIEKLCGKKAIKKYLPMQPGDVLETYANIDPLIGDIGFEPKTTIEEGLSKFVKWYLSYNKR